MRGQGPRATNDRLDVSSRFAQLPGWEIVADGLRDLDSGRTTVSALLVRSASVRLTELGVPVGRHDGADDGALYDLVVAEVGERAAHARYNALRRRLASFLRAASHARSR